MSIRTVQCLALISGILVTSLSEFLRDVAVKQSVVSLSPELVHAIVLLSSICRTPSTPSSSSMGPETHRFIQTVETYKRSLEPLSRFVTRLMTKSPSLVLHQADPGKRLLNGRSRVNENLVAYLASLRELISSLAPYGGINTCALLMSNLFPRAIRHPLNFAHLPSLSSTR